MSARIVDDKFKKNKLQYFVQSMLAGCAVVAALFFFDVVTRPIIIASFGASAFIVFTRPHQKIASLRNVLGGYIAGIIVGMIIHYIIIIPAVENEFTVRVMYIISGGIAVFSAMFLMSIFDIEHAPAASIALGLVLNNWDAKTIIYILIGITIVSCIKQFTKRYMIDLS